MIRPPEKSFPARCTMVVRRVRKPVGQEIENMKIVKMLFVVVCASVLMAGANWAADEKKPCCDAKADSLKCECPCCKKAADKGKVCKKCHPDQAKPADKK